MIAWYDFASRVTWASLLRAWKVWLEFQESLRHPRRFPAVVVAADPRDPAVGTEERLECPEWNRLQAT